ncbi:hypothetical protein J1614_006612 [Plenodomus biglobosus]|nr:hypothetical protein J1614_006612 [Plenodomus biglobosus]
MGGSVMSITVTEYEKLQNDLRRARAETAEAKAELRDARKRFGMKEPEKKTFFKEDSAYISFPKDLDAYMTAPDKRHGKLPANFYRTTYEKSATITPFNTKGCWPSNHPNLEEGLAYQSMARFLPMRDVTYERCLRHFSWGRKDPWTSWISTYDTRTLAIKRAIFLYHKSKLQCRRIILTEIDTEGLVPAFFNAIELVACDDEDDTAAKELSTDAERKESVDVSSSTEVPDEDPEKEHEDSEGVDAESEEVSDGVPEEVSDAETEQIPDAESEEVPDAESEEIPDAESEEIHDVESEEVSDGDPEELTDAGSEEVSDGDPEELTDAGSEKEVPDEEFEEVFNTIPGEIPRFLSSKYMAYTRAKFPSIEIRANVSGLLGHARKTSRIPTTTPITGPTKTPSDRSKMKEVHIKVPCWVRAHAVPKDRSNITLARFAKSRSEFWLSVAENRRSGLYLPATGYVKHGQPEEWLAGGFIHRSSITGIWPYDGKKIHQSQGKKVITSKNCEDWQFDWEGQIWRCCSEMKLIKNAFQQAEEKKKRKADRLEADKDELASRFSSTDAGYKKVFR